MTSKWFHALSSVRNVFYSDLSDTQIAFYSSVRLRTIQAIRRGELDLGRLRVKDAIRISKLQGLAEEVSGW